MKNIDCWVTLEGSSADLAFLADRLSFESVSIVHEDGQYQLRSDSFSGTTDSGELRLLAKDLVLRINGIARLYNSLFQPVRDGAVICEDAMGNRNISETVKVAIQVSETAQVTVRNADGSETEHTSPKLNLEPVLQLAAEDERVRYVLGMLSSRKLKPTDCYHMYEVVKKDVGPGAIQSHGWASSKSINRFTQSVNSTDVFGPDARHGDGKVLAPSNPMYLPECRAFVQRLVEEWIRSKL